MTKFLICMLSQSASYITLVFGMFISIQMLNFAFNTNYHFNLIEHGFLGAIIMILVGIWTFFLKRKSLKERNDLRDQFARAALPAVIYVAAKCAVEDTGINPNKLAVDSYRVADAMMAEREKRKNNE